MRLLFVSLMSTILLTHKSYAQSQAISKVYIFNPSRSLQPAIAPKSVLRIKPIRGTGYTLIETDTHSLAFINPKGQAVYLL